MRWLWVYQSLAEEFPHWTLFFCVAHWRRKLIEAKDEDRRAGWFLLQLRHLYEIERRLRQQKAGPRLRAAVRASEARPIWDRLRRVVALWAPRMLPQSRMGKALNYASNLWEGLCRYVDHGQVEIDDNVGSGVGASTELKSIRCSSSHWLRGMVRPPIP